MESESLDDFKVFILKRLKKEGLGNPRIIKTRKSCDSIISIKKKSYSIINKKSKLIRLIKAAYKWNIPFNIDLKKTVENIDKIDINKIGKKLKDQIKFLEFKQLCVSNLSRTTFPKQTIDTIIATETQRDLDQILKQIPYYVLIANGLTREKKDEYLETEGSVRVIYTNMKNQ